MVFLISAPLLRKKSRLFSAIFSKLNKWKFFSKIFRLLLETFGKKWNFFVDFLWKQEYKLFIRQLISWFYNRNFSFGLTTRGSIVRIISRTSTARNCQRWFSIGNLCGYSFRGCSSCRCSKSRRRSIVICSQFFQIQCFSRISFENSRIHLNIISVLDSLMQGSTDQSRLVLVQTNFRNLGPVRTRTAKKFETWDRTRTKKNFQISDRTRSRSRTTKKLKI